MKILNVTRSVVLIAGLSGVSLTAIADALGSCTADAGRARYAVENVCYDDYGTASGNWSVVDHSALDQCLNDAGREHSEEILVCRDLYAVKERPPYENRENAAATGIGLFILLFSIFGV